uniref:Uncharacterized protein n=1 Tax=Arundo donax TaxID=35708 RepID=A0A0A9HGU1_ARUDO
MGQANDDDFSGITLLATNYLKENRKVLEGYTPTSAYKYT